MAGMKRQFSWVPSTYSKICFDHLFIEYFREEDTCNTPGLIIRLNPDTIPCTNLQIEHLTNNSGKINEKLVL